MSGFFSPRSNFGSAPERIAEELGQIGQQGSTLGRQNAYQPQRLYKSYAPVVVATNASPAGILTSDVFVIAEQGTLVEVLVISELASSAASSNVWLELGQTGPVGLPGMGFMQGTAVNTGARKMIGSPDGLHWDQGTSSSNSCGGMVGGAVTDVITTPVEMQINLFVGTTAGSTIITAENTHMWVVVF